jgi:hypothetical protein
MSMQSSQHGHKASSKWHRTDALGGAIPDAGMQRTAPECACACSSTLLEAQAQAPALEHSEQQDLQEASIATQLPEAAQVFNAG